MTRVHALPVLLVAFAAGCGGADAEAGPPELHPWMAAAVRAMPGYEIEPAIFDRYAAESHEEAEERAFPAGTPSDDPAARAAYAAEIHRGMLDRAFTEGRTDLVDVLTRAYVAAAEAAR
jgi:hypothetical protein